MFDKAQNTFFYYSQKYAFSNPIKLEHFQGVYLHLACTKFNGYLTSVSLKFPNFKLAVGLSIAINPSQELSL